MSAEFVKALHRTVDAASVMLNPILNFDAFKQGLKDHPDDQFVSYILNGIQNGVSVGCINNDSIRGSNINWNSCDKFSEDVKDQFVKDITLQRKIGPLDPVPKHYVFPIRCLST